ncbi:hypothetical protein DICA0_A07096 [Diutina catenulata]
MSDPVSIREATQADLSWIVPLVAINSKDAVEDQSKGFLQSAIPESALAHWIPNIRVVEYDGKPAGFTHSDQLEKTGHMQPAIRYVSDHLDTLKVDGTPLSQIDFEIYGPALIAEEFRGKGLYKKLFSAVGHELQNRGCKVLVAFVDTINPLSLQVHQKLGCQIIGEGTNSGAHFYILSYSLT